MPTSASLSPPASWPIAVHRSVLHAISIAATALTPRPGLLREERRSALSPGLLGSHCLIGVLLLGNLPQAAVIFVPAKNGPGGSPWCADGRAKTA